MHCETLKYIGTIDLYEPLHNYIVRDLKFQLVKIFVLFTWVTEPDIL